MSIFLIYEGSPSSQGAPVEELSPCQSLQMEEDGEEAQKREKPASINYQNVSRRISISITDKLITLQSTGFIRNCNCSEVMQQELEKQYKNPISWLHHEPHSTALTSKSPNHIPFVFLHYSLKRKSQRYSYQAYDGSSDLHVIYLNLCNFLLKTIFVHVY